MTGFGKLSNGEEASNTPPSVMTSFITAEDGLFKMESTEFERATIGDLKWGRVKLSPGEEESRTLEGFLDASTVLFDWVFNAWKDEGRIGLLEAGSCPGGKLDK